jgi:hypothetical protein
MWVVGWLIYFTYRKAGRLYFPADFENCPVLIDSARKRIERFIRVIGGLDIFKLSFLKRRRVNRNLLRANCFSICPERDKNEGKFFPPGAAPTKSNKVKSFRKLTFFHRHFQSFREISKKFPLQNHANRKLPFSLL